MERALLSYFGFRFELSVIQKPSKHAKGYINLLAMLITLINCPSLAIGFTVPLANDSIETKVDLLPADNHFLIKGKINGKNAYFLLDTGASYTVLHSKSAKHFDFNIFQSSSNNRNSTSINNKASFKRDTAIDVMLDFGQPSYKQAYYSQNLTPVINHVFSISKIRITGIIGTDLLKQYGCTVDIGNKVLRFN